MFDSLFGSDDDDEAEQNSQDTPPGDESEMPDRPTTITGDPYTFERAGGQYAADGITKTVTETAEQGPVAGPEIRELLERARDHPDMPLWIGYNDSAQQGFDPAPVEFDQLFQHLWVAGTTGAGKTTELLNWMQQLAWGGHGFIYFDPKAEDSKDLLQKLPEHRRDDIVWIEPGDDDHDRNIGINFLEVPDCESKTELEQHINDRIQVLKAVLSDDDYWGPRMNAIVDSMARAMMLANHDIEDPTEQYCVLDMYFILLNAERREDYAETVDDPWVSEFVGEIAEMDDDAVRPVITRLKPWVESPVTRRIAGCRESTINFRDILDDDKIVIVRTAVSDDDIKQLVTLGTLRPLWNAVQNRSRQGDEKTPFFAFLDEADRILHANLDIDDMLARARSMRMSVTLACQYPSQLDESGVLKAVKNNCNTGVFFRVMDDQDARPLTRRISDCEIEDFTELEDYRIWSRIPLDGGARFSGALKLRTFAPYPDVRGETEAEEIIEASLERHGTEPLSDDEMMRQLKFGEMNEAVTPGKASADTLDVSDDERARNAALKAIYDESIRAGDPGGYTSIEACLDRLNRYLPATGRLKSPGQAWRNVLKDIPEPYLSHREESGQMQVRVESRSFMHVGDNENDGGAEHWATMKDAYVPMTQLGFVFDIPEQDGSDMPDAIARLDDALDLPDGENLNAKLDAIDDYQEQYPVLDRLAGVEDAYVESEHSTGSSQPSQTVENVNQAYTADRRCLLVCREQTAKRVATTLLDEPKGCHKNHDVNGERRLYTLTRDVVIDGKTMTRPGSRNNIWVHDSDGGEYILRDDDGTEYARFSSATAIRENASAYPDSGEWRVKAPVIPRYDPDMLDIIIVPEDAEAPNDLLVYRRDGAPIPLPDLTDRHSSKTSRDQQQAASDTNEEGTDDKPATPAKKETESETMNNKAPAEDAPKSANEENEKSGLDNLL